MKSTYRWSCFFNIFLILMVIGGCARTDLPAPHYRSSNLDPPDELIFEKKVSDARYLNIKGFEHMKVDLHLLERIESYNELQGIVAKKTFIESFLKDAFALNDKVVSDAANKLPESDIILYFYSVHPKEEKEWDDADFFDPNVPGDTARERFINAYRIHADKEFQKELEGLSSLEDESEVDSYWNYFLSNVEESILTKGRTARLLKTAPFVPIIYAWIWYIAETEDREPHIPAFKDRTVFYPEGDDEDADPALITDDWSLLKYYAPIYVLEKASQPSYNPKIDRFGEVWMSGSDITNATPKVYIDKPTVYAYLEKKKYGDDFIRQLVYTRWYPEHPKLRKHDPEAGLMDGWTIRISLNKDNRPLIFESVANCGCYYKVFPTERLEKMSKEEYPERLKDKTFHLENEVSGKIDVVIPELISFHDNPIQKLVAYYSAGKHHLETIRPIQEMYPVDKKSPRESYNLIPYESLENLPFQDYHISLFDENGLVRKADRLECTLLAPSGLFHAGHPRQRNTQLIYFDQAAFDDEKLFEQYMRMPDKVFLRSFD
jgi:hypothetical protein